MKTRKYMQQAKNSIDELIKMCDKRKIKLRKGISILMGVITILCFPFNSKGFFNEPTNDLTPGLSNKLFDSNPDKNKEYLAKAGHSYYKFPKNVRDHAVYLQFIPQGFKDHSVSINPTDREYKKEEYQYTFFPLSNLTWKFARGSRAVNMLALSINQISTDNSSVSKTNKKVSKAPSNKKDNIEMAAIAFDKSGDLDSAAKMYKRFLAFPKTESHKKYGYRLAEIYEKLEAIPKAIAQYHKNIKLFPDDFRNYEKLNTLLIEGKKYGTAQVILLKATKQPTCPNIFFKKLAQAYSFQNKKKAAALAYEQYLRNNLNDSLAWYEFGSLYYSLKIYKKAIGPLEKAVELMPLHSSSLNKLTDSYIKTGDLDKAVHALQKKLIQNPSNDTVLLELADVYTRDKKNQKVAEIYEKLFELNPEKNKEYLVKAGNIYYKIPIKEKAYAVYSKIKSLGIENPVVSINLAKLEYEKKEYQKVVLLLMDLEGKYAKDTSVINMLVLSSIQIGTQNLSTQEINQLVSKAPNNKKVIEIAAIANDKKGDLNSAAKMYKRFLAFPKTESHKDYGYRLAEIYEKQEAIPNAIAQYQKNIKLFPDDFRNYEKLNALLLKEKKYNIAQVILLKATKQPTCPVILFKNLAQVYSLQNKKKTAALAYEQYLRNNLNDSLAWYEFGSIYHSLKLYEKAIGPLKKALELMPLHSASLNKLTDSYIKTGDLDQAVHSLQKKLVQDPSNENVLLELANVYQRDKKNQKVAEIYEKVFDLNSDKNKDYLAKAGHIYYKIPIKEKAYAVYSKLISLGVKDPLVSINLAEMEFEKKQYQKTISLLKDMEGKFAKDSRVVNMLVQSNSQIGTDDLSVEEIDQMVSKAPNNKDNIEMAAIAYDKKGEINSAAKMYKRFLAFPKGESHKKHGYRLAEIYETQKALPFAIAQYQKNIRLFPDDFRNYEKLNALLIEEKKYNIAQVILLKATKQPTCPNIFFKNLAEAYSFQNKKKEAAIAYEQYLRNNLNDSLAWYEFGSLYYSLKIYKKAIGPLEKAVELMPLHSASLDKLTDSYIKTGDLEKAVHSLQKALIQDPSNENALIELANVYNKGKKSQKEAETYEKVFDLNTDKNKKYLAKAGHIYYKIPIKEKAYTVYSKCLSLNIKDPVVSINLAEMEFEKKKYQKVISLLKDIEGKYAKDSRVVNMLKQSYTQIGTDNLKVPDIDKLVSRAPNNKDIIEMAAIAYEKEGDINSAAKMYKKFLAFPKEESHKKYGYRLAEIYETQQLIPGAITRYQKNIRLFPDDFRNYEKLNALLIEGKKYNTAEVILLKATKQPTCPNVFFKKLAQVYSFQNKKKEAAKAYEQYLRNNLNDSLAWYEFGSLYYSMKIYKKAIGPLEKAVELMPLHSASMNKLTDSYIKTGDLDQAVHSLQKKLIIDPSNEDVLLEMANVYKLGKNKQKEAEIYEKVFDLNTDKNEKYLAKAGHIYFNIPIKDKAHAVYSKLISLNYKDPVVSINLAEMEFEKKQYQKTISLLNDIEGKHAKDSRVVNMLKQSYTHIGTENLTVTDINKLVSKAPNNKDIIEMAAIAYEKMDELESAVKMYKKFLTFPREESHQKYAYHLTTLYKKMNKMTLAAKQYLINIQKFPDDIRNYTDLIEFYKTEKNYPRTATILVKAIKLPSAPPEYFKELAAIYHKQNNQAQASVLYKKYLEKVPDDFEVWKILGSLYFSQHKYKLAITPLEKSITYGTNDSSTFYNLGLSYYKTGHFENAVDILKKALTLRHDENKILILLSKCYSASKDTLNLIENINERIAMFPKNIDLQLKKGELLLASQKYEDAAGVFETVHKMKPRNVKAIKMLIELYEETVNNAMLIETIDKALEHLPRNPYINYKKAIYHILTDDFVVAKQFLTKTLALQPRHTLAHYNLAKLLEQERNYKTAHYHYLQALKAEPRNIEFILKFAETSHILGKRGQAIKSLNRALKIDPTNSRALQLRGSI